MLTFRNAVVEDFEDFNELFTKRGLLGEEEIPGQSAMSRSNFDDHISNEDIILAEEENNMVGYAIVEPYEDGLVKICDIQMRKDLIECVYDFFKHIEAEAISIGMQKIRVISDTLETDKMLVRMKYRSLDSDLYEKVL